MCVEHISSPVSNARSKVEHAYTGPLTSELAEEMCLCSADVSCLLRSLINSTASYKIWRGL